ncbi:MAG: hypothetical protein ACRDGR_00315, partial [bacterium]
LPDLRLRYDILFDDAPDPIGSCEVTFGNVETERGKRLRVGGETDYTLPLKTPWRYQESVEIHCDARGVEKFEAETTAGDIAKKHVGIRREKTYHVTSTMVGGETTEKEFPDDVRRSNLAMFCGAYLEERLDQDELLREFPLLWPSQGMRYPRQKFRESIMPFQVSADRKVRAIISTIRKSNKVPVVDRYYHVADDLMILLRLVEETDAGVITYELTAVDGVPLADSPLVR